MTRSDLVDALCERFAHLLPPEQADLAVRAILGTIGAALIRGQRVEVRGFGSFTVHHRAPRIGRNPRSGQAVAVQAKCLPHFKPGKALRASVDKNS